MLKKPFILNPGFSNVNLKIRLVELLFSLNIIIFQIFFCWFFHRIFAIWIFDIVLDYSVLTNYDSPLECVCFCTHFFVFCFHSLAYFNFISMAKSLFLFCLGSLGSIAEYIFSFSSLDLWSNIIPFTIRLRCWSNNMSSFITNTIGRCFLFFHLSNQSRIISIRDLVCKYFRVLCLSFGEVKYSSNFPFSLYIFLVHTRLIFLFTFLTLLLS